MIALAIEADMFEKKARKISKHCFKTIIDSTLNLPWKTKFWTYREPLDFDVEDLVSSRAP
jgi:hypothetical protein